MRRLLLVLLSAGCAACTKAPAPEAPPVTPPAKAAPAPAPGMGVVTASPDAATVPAPAAGSDAERAFAVLADDHAAPESWQEAAATLVFAADLDHPKALAGDALRGRAAPSVGDLMAKRIATPGLDVDIASGLADALLRWDPAVGKPIAAAQMARAIHATDGHDHETIISALAVDRADAGDLAALDDYAAWVVTLRPSESGLDHDSFIPMALFPTRPAIAKASERLFRDGSPWVPIMSPVVRPDKDQHMAPDYLLEPTTPGKVGGFIAVSGLNQHVVKALADKRVVGKLVVEGGGLNIEWIDGGTSSIGVGDPPPANGIKRTVRVCDYYAWHLSGHDGAPAFDLTWPDAQRDQVFAGMTTWVKAQVGKASRRPIGM